LPDRRSDRLAEGDGIARRSHDERHGRRCDRRLHEYIVGGAASRMLLYFVSLITPTISRLLFSSTEKPARRPRGPSPGHSARAAAWLMTTTLGDVRAS
jgi:hypothetical protein